MFIQSILESTFLFDFKIVNWLMNISMILGDVKVDNITITQYRIGDIVRIKWGYLH